MIFQAEFWCIMFYAAPQNFEMETIFVCEAHVTIPNYSGPKLTGPMGITIA